MKCRLVVFVLLSFPLFAVAEHSNELPAKTEKIPRPFAEQRGTEKQETWTKLFLTKIDERNLKNGYHTWFQDGKTISIDTLDTRGEGFYCSLLPRTEETRDFWPAGGLFKSDTFYRLQYPPEREPDHFNKEKEMLVYRMVDGKGRTVAKVTLNNLSIRKVNDLEMSHGKTIESLLGSCLKGYGVPAGALLFGDVWDAIDSAESKFSSGQEKERRRFVGYGPGPSFNGNREYWVGAYLPGGRFGSSETKDSFEKLVKKVGADLAMPEIYQEYWINQYSKVPVIP